MTFCLRKIVCQITRSATIDPMRDISKDKFPNFCRQVVRHWETDTTKKITRHLIYLPAGNFSKVRLCTTIEILKFVYICVCFDHNAKKHTLARILYSIEILDKIKRCCNDLSATEARSCRVAPICSYLSPGLLIRGLCCARLAVPYPFVN